MDGPTRGWIILKKSTRYLRYAEQMSNSQATLRQIQERLDGLEETMEILADKKTLPSIKKSLNDIRQGRYKDYRSVKQFKAEFESRAWHTL